MRPCRLPSRVTASARRRRHATSRMDCTRPLHLPDQVTVNVAPPRRAMMTTNMNTQRPHGSLIECASASSVHAPMAYRWPHPSAKSITWRRVFRARPAHKPSISAIRKRVCVGHQGQTATWVHVTANGLLKVATGQNNAFHITIGHGYQSSGPSHSLLKPSNPHLRLCWIVVLSYWMVKVQRWRWKRKSCNSDYWWW